MGFWLAIGAVIVVLLWRDHKKWRSWPTLDEYWAANPDCKSSEGVRCKQCNSFSLEHLGWRQADSTRRLHRCNHCSTFLYRSGCWSWLR